PCVHDSAIAGHVFVFAYMVESVQRVPRPYKTIKLHFIRCTQKCHPRSKHELVTHRPETTNAHKEGTVTQSNLSIMTENFRYCESISCCQERKLCGVYRILLEH